MMTELYAHLIDIVVIKGTVVVGTATAICYALRRSSAATRHGVWAAVFLVLLALPALRLVTLRSNITVVGLEPPAAMLRHDGSQEATGAPASSQSARRAIASPQGPAMAPGQPPLPSGTTWIYGWIVALWFAGLVCQLSRFVAHLRALRRLQHCAQACSPAVERRVSEIAAELGMRQAPRTIVSSHVSVPSTFGLSGRTIVLPQSAQEWSGDQLDAALLHELAHLRRGDYLTHLIAALVRAGYWLNPAVWYASRRLDTERERSCDDGVVTRIDPIRYAEYLLRLAWCGRRTVAQSMLSLAGGSSLRERIRSLVDRAQARAPVSRGTRIVIVTAAVWVAVSAAAVEIVGVVAQSAEQHAASLTDPDPLVRRRAAWALGEAESRRHVDELIERLADPDARVRVVSAWALGEIKDPRAVEPLMAVLTDREPRVREMAVLAIGEIEDPAGLAALRSAGPSVVSAAARSWAIAQIEHADAPEVLAGELEQAGPQASQLSRYLNQLGARDPASRARAAQQLGMLGAAEAVDALLDALEDEHSAVRAAAIWALDEINPTRDRSHGPG